MHNRYSLAVFLSLSRSLAHRLPLFLSLLSPTIDFVLTVATVQMSPQRNHIATIMICCKKYYLLSPVLDGSNVHNCFFFKLAPLAFNL